MLYFFASNLYSDLMKGALSSKGQVTIPKNVRDELGLSAGDVIEFVAEGGAIVGRKKIARGSWNRFVGVLADGRTTDEVMRELRPDRAW